MLRFNKMLATSALVLAATLAQADTASDMNAFRALTAVATEQAPLTAAIMPVDVSDAASAKKGVLTAGDKIAFEVDGVKGASVYILNMDTQGNITMLYPNQFQDPDAPETGQTLTLPAKDAAYEFQVTGAPGTEVVKVIAVEGDASMFDALLGSLFDQKQAFPRAINAAEATTDALAAFFEAPSTANVRETTFDYVIAK